MSSSANERARGFVQVLRRIFALAVPSIAATSGMMFVAVPAFVQICPIRAMQKNASTRRAALRADFSDPGYARLAGSYAPDCGERTWPVAYTDPRSFNARPGRGLIIRAYEDIEVAATEMPEADVATLIQLLDESGQAEVREFVFTRGQGRPEH